MGAGVLLQIAELGLNEIVPIEGLIARLHSIFTLNPDVKINIQHLSSEAIQADADTLQMVADWQTKNGLPVTVKPPAQVIPISSSTGSTPALPESSAAASAAAAGAGSDSGAAPAATGSQAAPLGPIRAIVTEGNSTASAPAPEDAAKGDQPQHATNSGSPP